MMTNDDLRHRIAKALFDNSARNVWRLNWNFTNDEVKKSWLSDADVLIRELGLRIQVAGPDGIVGTGNYRYVTEWETTDE